MTIYTPPTPIWAALIFILIGVVMLVGGGVAVVANVLRPKDPIGMVFFGAMAVVGCLAIIHGLRVVISPGKV